VLLAKMPILDEMIQRRREIARRYGERLSEFGDVDHPPGPDDESDRCDVYQNCEIEVSERDALQWFLRERGVYTNVPWGGKAIHQIKELGLGTSHLPVTDRVFERCLMLPMHHMLRDDQVEVVCDSLTSYLA